MARAQLTAWSERRSQAGASVVAVIMGTSVMGSAVTVLQYSRLTSGICARILVLEGLHRLRSVRWDVTCAHNNNLASGGSPGRVAAASWRAVLNLCSGMPRGSHGPPTAPA